MKNNISKAKNISINSDEYPESLKNIFDPPKDLNALGDIDKFASSPKVAIVGTRRPTRYGLEVAETLARDLSNMGVVIVSGLALGIDSAAHRGALDGQTPTWAVLGSGLFNIQPTINRPLAEKIVAGGGAIISEFEDTYPADKWTFPQRNRIVAGLTQATIVVEASERSGALITADLAMQYGRDVGAVPGETTSLNSRGTNNLIKNGAALIRSAEDVLELIGLEQKKLKLDNFDELENNILRLLESPLCADDISASLSQNILAVNQKLSILELKGAIKNRAGLFHKL